MLLHGIDGEIASPALAHAGLGRQVEDVRAIGEQVAEIGVLDAAPRRTGSAGRPCRPEVPLLDRPRVVVGEAVDADDVGAVAEQPLGERRADEAGDAGDQCLHDDRRRSLADAFGQPARPAARDRARRARCGPWRAARRRRAARPRSRTCTRTGDSSAPCRPDLELVVVARRLAGTRSALR